MQFQQYIIVGNLTKDPELKYTNSGMAICSGTIATNRKYKKDDGSMAEETAFVLYTLFGKTAELARDSLKKGTNIMFVGHLKTESWEDKNTHEKKSVLKLIVDTMKFIEKKEESEHSQSGKTGQSAPAEAEESGGDAPF